MAGVGLVVEGRVSVFSFVLGVSVISLPFITSRYTEPGQTLLGSSPGRITLLVFVALMNGVLLLLYRAPFYQVAIRAAFLGFAFGCGLLVSITQSPWRHFGCVIGLFMVLFGESLRKSAMLTAGSNFNHIVQNEKSETHTLVTGGVYSWFRHPSYVGWFYWSIGTQVLLCNPVCLVGYTLASWRFFRERVEEEEFSLIHFFGQEYIDYKRTVPTGLPFINGVKVEP
ncbi:hypothetical protein GDO78_010954 [Eleutherodactylus coqui]|uniref:Protein-S-isoprenylcysteine O-methyltransferase n=1 Tax=Eleutherodactylus coqui TaxID=57060 RepID=A0A8J6K7H5_ELECQ|nr:hypothetical protein GDO78_010954 [Eleutherodactylus coqui]